MDNLTHSMTGLAVAHCFPSERWGRWVAPVGIVAANLPDIELDFANFSDKAYYLVYHRGWSHGLIGITVQALVLSLVVVGIGKLLDRNRTDKICPPLWAVFALCAVEGYVHLLLDWFNTYGVRPFYPIDTTWHYGDILFVMDPWVWLMLGGTLMLSGGSNRFGNIVWIAVACITTYLVSFACMRGITPLPVLAVWLLAITGFVIAGVKLKRGLQPGKAARVALSMMAAYVLTVAASNSMMHAQVLERYHNLQKSGDIIASSANPLPGTP